MKRMLVMVCMTALAVSVSKADCSWSWWAGDGKASSDVDGCALGLATERSDVEGAQVALCFNRAKAVDGGAQVSFGCNVAGSFGEGAQVSFGYNSADEFSEGAQVALGCNRVKKLREGVQVGLCNIADSASLQIGLVCINRTGFLPVFILFNFDRSMFRD